MTDYKSKFKMLSEYNIKNGVKLEPAQKHVELTEQDEEIAPPVEATPPPAEVEFEDKEEISKLPEYENLVKKDDIERVKEIQDLQTKKIEDLEGYLKSLGVDLTGLKSNLESMSEIQIQGFFDLSQKIKALTPPTPEENLEKMVKITHGTTPEDYFKQFDQELEAQTNSLQIAKDKYVLDLKDLYNSVNTKDKGIQDSLTNF